MVLPNKIIGTDFIYQKSDATCRTRKKTLETLKNIDAVII